MMTKEELVDTILILRKNMEPLTRELIAKQLVIESQAKEIARAKEENNRINIWVDQNSEYYRKKYLSACDDFVQLRTDREVVSQKLSAAAESLEKVHEGVAQLRRSDYTSVEQMQNFIKSWDWQYSVLEKIKYGVR